MEQLNFSFPARRAISGRVHVGVVGSGDLEVLLEPSADSQAHVNVNTSGAGECPNGSAIGGRVADAGSIPCGFNRA